MLPEMKVTRAVAAATLVPFSANTRLSGLDAGGRSWRKGAGDSVLALTKGAAAAAAGSRELHPRVATTTFRNWDLPERRQIFSGVRLAADA